MAKKSIVVISSNGEKVPFLRGILVQSLTAVGLSFEDAYATAQRIRDRLGSLDEIDSTTLRDQVAQALAQDFGTEVERVYLAAQSRGREITVRSQSREAPFSVGILTRYLEGCAIGRKQALNGARKVQARLREYGQPAIDRLALRRVVFDTLEQACSPAAAGRYLSRCHFEDSGKPLIVLIGGVSGAGKSTVASDLAYHLEISRTQSTDIIREIVRSYQPADSARTLEYSSFDAWRGLPRDEHAKSPVIAGFLAQIDAIKAGLDATIGRAVKERQDLILDGVHVIPSRLDLAQVEQQAVLVAFTLAVASPQRLSRQLGRRSGQQPERQSSRQQEHLDALWEIQSYLLDQAERNDIAVALNWSVSDTVQGMLKEIMQRISERFPPDADTLVDPR